MLWHSCLVQVYVFSFLSYLKAPYSSKTDIFIQERFRQLIYSINTIIKCGIWQPVFELDQKWNDFYRISELMFATIKNIILFQERETNWYFTGCNVPHFMIIFIPYINLLKLFFFIIKCLFLRNMEPLIVEIHWRFRMTLEDRPRKLWNCIIIYGHIKPA